jgi:4-amino-4-deoxy-L-arabinose transferase-like glycosyltransferase
VNHQNLQTKIFDFFARHEQIIVLILLAAGIFARLFLLGVYPVGFNQDEASAGYEAYALLKTGMDRCGNTWPVLLVSWGSGQNVLYTYLTIPLVAIFGLSEFSVRLTSALFGIAALPVFYLFAKRIRGGGFALTALLVLALNPWHIMLSRWGLESNLLPFFLLLGSYFLMLSNKRPGFLALSALAFGLSLYCYGTAFFFLIFFGLPCVVLLFLQKTKARVLLISGVVFLLIALPITAAQVINALRLHQTSFLGLTLPLLTQTRQDATTIFSSSHPLADAVRNFLSFCLMLARGSDGYSFNSYAPFGLFYVFGLPFAVYGLAVSLWNAFRKAWDGTDAVMLLSLAAAFLCSFFISPNVNRMNMSYLPILYFNALGVYDLLRRFRICLLPVAAAYGIAFALFVQAYFTTYPQQMSQIFFEGLGPAIQYAETVRSDREYVTDQGYMPYIYVLFYNQILPQEFLDSVEYENPQGAFRAVESFGPYVFGQYPADPGGVYVVSREELPLFNGEISCTYFGNYCVVVPR